MGIPTVNGAILYDKGYTGLVGMEHGISQKGIEGEQRLIQAYREVDDFEV